MVGFFTGSQFQDAKGGESSGIDIPRPKEYILAQLSLSGTVEHHQLKAEKHSNFEIAMPAETVEERDLSAIIIRPEPIRLEISSTTITGRLTEHHTEPTFISTPYNRLKRALMDSDEEDFEDGIISVLSKKIKNILESNAPLALNALVEICEKGNMRIDSVAEAIKTIAHCDFILGSNRIAALRKFLRHESFYLREAAINGLEIIGTEEAIRELAKVKNNENEPWLRDQIEDIVESSK